MAIMPAVESTIFYNKIPHVNSMIPVEGKLFDHLYT